jgi:hypothetical protein
VTRPAAIFVPPTSTARADSTVAPAPGAIAPGR